LVFVSVNQQFKGKNTIHPYAVTNHSLNGKHPATNRSKNGKNYSGDSLH
jgi:hypothetical protein